MGKGNPGAESQECSELIVSLLFLLLARTGTAAAATSAVVLGDNGCADSLDLLVLLLDLLSIRLRVGVQPGLTILQRVQDLLLLVGVHLLAQALVVTRALGGGPHAVDVAIEGVLRVDALLDLLILIGEKMD